MTDLAELRQVLAAFEQGEPNVMLKLLHRFQALTGVRPTEAREAEWREFAVPGEWRIPAERMKGHKGRGKPHTVYLSRQAEDVLAVARMLAPLGARYVFPSERYWRMRHQPFERSTLGIAMQRWLPARVHVAHGWRASLRTVLGRLHRRDRDLIEMMLAHTTKGAVERLYDRTEGADWEDQLRALWAEWATLLLEGAPSAWALAGLPEPERDNVVEITGRAA